MNTSINFNELKKLAANAEKTRTVLGCMRVEFGQAVWTDGLYMVVMEGYDKTPDMIIRLSDYSVHKLDYPNIDRIVNQAFEEQEYKETILEGQVIYEYERRDEDGEKNIYYIDKTLLDQLQKMVALKKYTVTISKIEINQTQSFGRLRVDDNTRIYFGLKRINRK